MTTDSHDQSEQRRLRRVLGQFATGVTVVTARAKNGANLGVTANSFNSVSLDPPLILWSLAKSAASLPAFKAAEHFAVHVLAEDQVDLSDHFARKREDKFASVPFREGLGGTPLIEGCAARFQCRTYALHDGGDHWIIVGEVLGFEEGGRPALVYYQGSYAISVPYQDSVDAPVGEDVQPEFEQGVYSQLVRAVHAMQDSLTPLHETFGVSANEARVLGMLKESLACDESFLSHHARAPLPEMRAVLHDMRQRSLIEPQAEKTGVWTLTGQGAKVAHALWTQRLAQERRALASLSAGEIEVLQRSLKRIGDWGDGEA